MSAPVIEVERRGFRAPGTMFMVSGGVLGGIGALLFTIYGGRALGAEAFAPVGILWTAFFIMVTVLLVPVEQYVTREVASGRKALPHDLGPTAVMAAIGAVVGCGFVLLYLDRFFEGSWQYVAQFALLSVGYALLFFGKGVLAGNRRFAGVGWILIIETTVRLVAGIVAVQLVARAESLGWAMVLGGFAVLGTRWWRYDKGHSGEAAAPAPKFLAGYVGGTSSAQLLLAGAPLAIALIANSPVLVSVFVATFTIFRAPMTLIFSLQGRILPFLVGLARDQDHIKLTRIARNVVVGGAVLALVGGAVGWVAGPPLISALFGPDFAPTSVVATFAAAGVVAASAAQITGQVLVAEGRTARLSVGWVGGLLAGIVALLLIGGAADTRVAASFAIGELTALALMAILAIRR